jgi:hypothetical protein
MKKTSLVWSLSQTSNWPKSREDTPESRAHEFIQALGERHKEVS